MQETSRFDIQPAEDDTIASPLDAAEKEGTRFLDMDAKLSHVERLIEKIHTEIRHMPDVSEDDPRLVKVLADLSELERQRHELMDEMFATQIRIGELVESAEELGRLAKKLTEPKLPRRQPSHPIAQA